MWLYKCQGGEITIEQSYVDTEGDDPLNLFLNLRGLMQSKLFKMDIIRQYNGRFDEDMKIAEDYAFTLDYIVHVKDYAFVSEAGYFYRRHNESVTTSCRRNYDTSLVEFRHQYNSTFNYIERFGLSEDQCRKRIDILSKYLLQTILLLYKSELKIDIYNRIQNDFTAAELQLLRAITGKRNSIILWLINNEQTLILKLFYNIKRYLQLCLKKK